MASDSDLRKVEVDVRYGYLMMFSTIVVFHSLNKFVSRYVETPQSVKEDPWRWRNLVISWIHGMICGTWNVLCFVLYPEIFDDLIEHINYFTYMMVAFSTGYFIYDSIDMYLNGRLLSNWEVTLHHIAVTSMFWSNVHQGSCIGYNCVALMAEINSFFLHSRKLLQMWKIGFDHWFYKLVTYLNLFTFVSCRGFSICRIFYGMYIEPSRVPFFFYCCLSLSMFVMSVINVVLFWRLFKSDILKPPKPQLKLNGNHNSFYRKDE
ncbi:TLC domain-containing protein 2-like [Saccostrea cucullata]|uniref:TLC domain-containing protein 2-like n=1 Tax=Saccostrea cuccullata TaxID=36930 RepID=UPI002ED50F9D